MVASGDRALSGFEKEQEQKGQKARQSFLENLPSFSLGIFWLYRLGMLPCFFFPTVGLTMKLVGVPRCGSTREARGPTGSLTNMSRDIGLLYGFVRHSSRMFQTHEEFEQFLTGSCFVCIIIVHFQICFQLLWFQARSHLTGHTFNC